MELISQEKFFNYFEYLMKKSEDFILFKDLFNIRAGNYLYSNAYQEGITPYITASNKNNGINSRIDLKPEFSKNSITTEKINCTVFYQAENYCASSDINIFNPKFKFNYKIGLFIATVINFNENFRWNYGRQCRVGDSNKIKIKLPIKGNELGPVINIDKLYHREGYIPDFEFMENYIDSLPYGDLLAEIL